MTILDVISVCGRHGHIDEGGALITCQDAGPHQGTLFANPRIIHEILPAHHNVLLCQLMHTSMAGFTY